MPERAAFRRSARPRALMAALLLLAAGACDRGSTPGGAVGEGDAVAGDTGAMDGLTREQIEAQVQPMTPEQAEQLGIVDTTELDQPAPVGPTAPIPGTPAPVAPGDTAIPR